MLIYSFWKYGVKLIFVLRTIHTDVYVYRNQCHVTTFQLYTDTQFSHSIMIFHDLHDNEIWKNKIKHAWFTSVKINTFYNLLWSCLVLISIECLLLYYNVNKISIFFSIFVIEFEYHSCHIRVEQKT